MEAAKYLANPSLPSKSSNLKLLSLLPMEAEVQTQEVEMAQTVGMIPTAMVLSSLTTANHFPPATRLNPTNVLKLMELTSAAFKLKVNTSQMSENTSTNSSATILLY